MRAEQLTTQKSFTVVGKTVAKDCKKQQTKQPSVTGPVLAVLGLRGSTLII